MVDYTTAHPDGSGEILIQEIRGLQSDLDALVERQEDLHLAIKNILVRLNAIERRIDRSTPKVWG